MKPARPVVLGVLGGIGSGKSTAARALEARGALVLDADRLARDALENPRLQKRLLERWGPAVLGAAGVDREVVARRVFANEAELRWLESLVHPLVHRRMAAALHDAVQEARVPAVVLDVPLLLEASPLRKYCDVLIFVDCDAALRRQRVQTLRGWSEAELDRREQHQDPPEQKRRAADVVFRNDGTEAELTREVTRWLDRSGGFAGLPRRKDLAPLAEHHHELPQESREERPGSRRSEP